MKSRIVELVIELAVAALLMWFDMRVFWLYFFAISLWNGSRVMAAIAANHFEIRVHLETIQNKVGVVPAVDANQLIEQMRDNLPEHEWKKICETFNFARRT